jgi:hypothetical protein
LHQLGASVAIFVITNRGKFRLTVFGKDLPESGVGAIFVAGSDKDELPISSSYGA